MSRTWIALGWLATVVVGGSTVVDLETTRTIGDPVLLPLAPRDPRSLVQGDFMRLNTLAARQANRRHRDEPPSGDIVLRIDDDGVGHFERFHAGEALGPREHLLDYRTVHDRIQVGTPSYMFEEGTAELYESARYGLYHIRPNGRSVLVGLNDADRRPLGPNSE